MEGSMIQRNRRVTPAGEPRCSAASTVQDALRRAILSIQLKPGEPLSEKEIAARFDVSRTPVREALIRLKEEGLVEIFPQSGTFVARIPAQSLPEAIVIRQALECKSVELAATGLDAERLGMIGQIILAQREAEQSGNQEGFHIADEAFHEALAEAVGHPGLWRVAQSVKIQIDRCRRLTLPVPGRMARVIRDHEGIMSAITARNPQAAISAMQAHLSAVLPDLALIRAEQPDYFV